MKVLVTGGAGFIGSHLAQGLVEAGHRVRVLDNFYAGRRANLSAVAADVELVEGDCSDPTVAERAARRMDVVYHQAAVPSVARSVEDPASAHRNSATATLVMLVAARAAGVRRFVYAGSSSVYGDGKQSRDFTYVANVVDGNLRALTAKGLAGQAVNLATGRRITLNALLKALARELGCDAGAVRMPARPGDIRHSLADVRLARRLLGYRPTVDFETGLRLTLDWYRETAGVSARPPRSGARAKRAGGAGPPSSSGTRDS